MIHYVAWGLVAACIFMWGAIFGQWHTLRRDRRRFVHVNEQPMLCVTCGGFEPGPGRAHIRKRDLKCMPESGLRPETAQDTK